MPYSLTVFLKLAAFTNEDKICSFVFVFDFVRFVNNGFLFLNYNTPDIIRRTGVEFHVFEPDKVIQMVL